MSAQLRFWLVALDVAHALRMPPRVYFWILDRASNATDWGAPEKHVDGEPF